MQFSNSSRIMLIVIVVVCETAQLLPFRTKLFSGEVEGAAMR